tara:strand:+ start:687 stop:3155 length:2469 start_codon:yes stop_codon:yes gene_type:complete
MSLKSIFSLIFLIVWNSPIISQINSVEVYNRLEKLNFLGSILYVAAHPDDENTALLSYFSTTKNATTGYLSLTRGGGGQNLIGNELKDALGVVRTEELLSARKIDKAEQFFSNAKDFGYSKTPEETLSIWNEKSVLKDIVYRIRAFQPDIIINRFDHRTPGSTHGHHTSSAILSMKAFKLSNDPNTFKDQLIKSKPWQPKRLFFNTSWWFYGSREKFKELDKKNLISINVGSFNHSKGILNSVIAAKSRSQHQSQGFGSSPILGANTEYVEYIAGEIPDKNDPFFGINTTWTRIKGGLEIQEIIINIINSFDFLKPYKSIPNLIELYNKINLLKNDIWKERKLKETLELIEACSGLILQANSSLPYGVKNSTLDVSIKVLQQSQKNIVLKSLSFRKNIKTINSQIVNNVLLEENVVITIPNNFSSPYWLLNNGSIGNYTVNEEGLSGLAITPDDLKIVFEFEIEGETLKFTKNISHRYTDPVRGEIIERFHVLPELTTTFDSNVYLFHEKKSKTINLKVNNFNNNFNGSIQLEVPEGWSIDPKKIDLNLIGVGNSKNLIFNIKPSTNSKEGYIKPIIRSSLDFKSSFAINILDYKHIPKQYILTPSIAKVVPLSINIPKIKIAYIPGAGDKIPESLSQIGLNVTKLSLKKLTLEELEKYKTLILGIRIFNIEEDLKYKNKIIWQFIENGGTLIIQYNISRGLKTNEIAPIKLNLSRDRVTDENSYVRILNSNELVLNYPNKITQQDFKGWIQERGLYFANKWSEDFTPVFGMKDKNEIEKTGSILIGKYGKGTVIYTGLSFFRQLPEGVPGAYRLFINLISQ